MHVAFALMLGVPMAHDGPPRVGQGAVAGLPGRSSRFVVVATANHWWFDAFTGALVAGRRGARGDRLRSRSGPAAWAWMPPAPAAAPQAV